MIHRFGEYALDDALQELRRDGRAVAVQPKVLKLLFYLVRERHRMVPKDELLDEVWPGTSVSESALGRALAAARRAVGDTGGEQRVIQTARGIGVRFVASVDGETAQAAPADAPAAGSGDPFVGRTTPLRLLEDAWEAALAGRGRVAVISGDAGIGKTRLAEEIAGRVRMAGGRTLSGFCPSTGGAPPFWPWSRALRGLGESEGMGVLERAASAAGIDLGDLLPEQAKRPSSVGWAESAPDRFAVFDALDRLLAALASEQPLLLILDDLHAADRSSLRALEHVARGLANESLLLVATYREGEVEGGHPLHETLANLCRGPEDLRLRLDPLDDRESEALVSALSGQTLEPDVARTIWMRSAGNPLFLRELVRAFTHDGVPPAPGGPLPPGISELLRSRIDRLDDDLQRVLIGGAVVGSEFELEILREVVDLDAASLSETLDRAIEGGWVRIVARGTLRYRFTHPLTQEILRLVPPPPERGALHARAAGALAERHPVRLDPVVERLAEHHLEMARWGRPDARAPELAQQAGDLAEQRLAFDEAVRWFERGLESLDLCEARDDELRVELLIGLARTRWTVGDRVGARAPVEEAVALARRMQRGDILARAALVLRARGAPPQDRHPNALDLLEEAERALGGVNESLRAVVIARTAEHLWFEPGGAHRIAPTTEQALELARAADDSETLANVLGSTLFGIWSHLSVRQRRDLTGELTALARKLADPTIRVEASSLHLTWLIEAGELETVDSEIARLEGEIGRLEVPSSFRWYGPLYRGMRAIMAGRLEEGEQLALASFGHARKFHVYDAGRAFQTQIFQIRADQGRQGELEEAVRTLSQRYPGDRSYVPFHAFILAETERTAAARPIFERFVDAYEPSLDNNRTLTSTILAHVCATLGDADRAKSLYERLVDDADRITVNVSAWICQGSFHWPLGRLAATQGQFDTALQHFLQAERRNEAIGAVPYLARTRLDLARLRAQNGDSAEARNSARLALDAAREVGMGVVTKQAEELLTRLSP